MAKAYREEYGQIPEKLLKQSVRAIKNLLERIRFYQYSNSAVPRGAYAPPREKDNQPAGNKFDELSEKSWASITNPDDERYPGWHQSTTSSEEIIKWLQAQDREEGLTLKSEESSDKELPIRQKSTTRTKRGTAQSTSGTVAKKKSEKSGPAKTNEVTRSPKDTSAKPKNKRQKIQQPTVPKSRTVHTKTPNLDTSASRPKGRISPIDTEMRDSSDVNSVATPPKERSQHAFSSHPHSPQAPVVQSDSRFASRAPTPGLDNKEELKTALRENRTDDIVHFFNLVHPGRSTERARALYRLSRDRAAGKEINLDAYLQGNGPLTRDSTPLIVQSIETNPFTAEHNQPSSRKRTKTSDGDDSGNEASDSAAPSNPNLIRKQHGGKHPPGHFHQKHLRELAQRQSPPEVSQSPPEVSENESDDTATPSPSDSFKAAQPRRQYGGKTLKNIPGYISKRTTPVESENEFDNAARLSTSSPQHAARRSSIQHSSPQSIQDHSMPEDSENNAGDEVTRSPVIRKNVSGKRLPGKTQQETDVALLGISISSQTPSQNQPAMSEEKTPDHPVNDSSQQKSPVASHKPIPHKQSLERMFFAEHSDNTTFPFYNRDRNENGKPIDAGGQPIGYLSVGEIEERYFESAFDSQ